MQRKKWSKRIEMIIKMVNKFKLTVFHFCAQTRCKSVHVHGFTAGQQNWVGLWAVAGRGPWAAGCWAFGLSGRWAVAGRGPRACIKLNPVWRSSDFRVRRHETTSRSADLWLGRKAQRIYLFIYLLQFNNNLQNTKTEKNFRKMP